jgi:hypothetical protein
MGIKGTDIIKSFEEVGKDLKETAKDLGKDLGKDIEEIGKDIIKTTETSIKNEVVKETEKIFDISLTKDILGGIGFPDIALAVNDLIDKSVDDIVMDEIKKIKYNLFVDSSLGEAISTADLYYKKILNSNHIMTKMRNDYTSSLTKNINNTINDKLNSLTSNKYARKILAKSKLGSTLTNMINTQVAGIINSIVSDKVIANVSNDIVTTITKLKSNAKAQLQTTFKNEIAYYKKIEKSVQDQIKKFEEQKQIYQQKLQAEVQRLKDAINAEIKKVEKAIVNEISKVINLDAAGFKF